NVANDTHHSSGASALAGTSAQYPYQVGKPGPGQPAPPLRLPATDGTVVDLAAWRGQGVLLFFQEGIACEPCWTQIKDIEAQRAQFQALGVDRMVSITSDPLGALKQKVADEGIATPLLSDPGLAVSRTYQANLYGMMGTSTDGHSFILVGKDGVVKWRADYGGPPKYSMYIPIPTLLADMRQGLGAAG
ncbi:MAG: redoxin domain-containing protein, partial [Chloroflexota bacterium]|nr:redoxin domain-containing protein [Chloroflexota bacterium]